MNNDQRAYDRFLTQNFDSEFINRLEALEESMFCIEQDEEFPLMIEGPGSMVFNDEYETELELDGLYASICEKSHGTLKYTYRMGIDLDTGKRVAIQFRLEPDKVTATGPHELKANLTCVHEIKNVGHINHCTDPLTVDCIFHQGGGALQHVRMIGVLNKNFQQWLTDMVEKYPAVFGKIPTTRIKITRWDELINDAAFPRLFKAFAVTVPTNTIETYHISKNDSDAEKQGGRKYKSTKLMWDHLRRMSSDYNAGRAFIPDDDVYYGRGHTQLKDDMDETI